MDNEFKQPATADKIAEYAAHLDWADRDVCRAQIRDYIFKAMVEQREDILKIIRDSRLISRHIGVLFNVGWESARKHILEALGETVEDTD